ncbi:MAG: alpha/beta hydrolase [Robiginitomaculum sp.]|nr:alpha/beta hydrolase [Robiginitomaculum sp.]
MRHFAMVLGLVFAITLMGCKAQEPAVGGFETSVQKTSADWYQIVDGLNIRYKIEGDNAKPSLVLLHGFTSSVESWDGLVAELEGNYQIIRLDLPGHGLTGPDPKHRYAHEDFVNAVHGLVKELNINNPTLIGNSMGGNTAWRYAATYPNEIANLILIDASGFPLNGLSETPLPLSPALETYFLKPTKFAVNYGLKNQYAKVAKIPDDRADKILEMMKSPGNGDAFVRIFKTFTLPDPTHELSKITAPTLLIWGEKDAVIPVSHAKLFGEAITNSEVEIIENSGHISHEENPVQTAAIINKFLTEK